MRTFLLIYCFITGIGASISQNLNFAGHSGVDYCSEMVSINSKSYFLEASFKDCNSSTTSLVCINDSGRTIAKYPFGTYPLRDFGKLIKTKDNALLFDGTSAGHFEVGPYEYTLIKMDTNGNVLSHYVNPVNEYGSRTIGISQHSDSSYYILFGKNGSPGHLSKTLQILPFTGPLMYQTGALLALTNGNILVNGILNSVRTNVIIAPSGSIIAQQACSNKIIKYVEYPTYILALTSTGIIEKYTTNLSIQGSSTLAINPTINQIKDFTVRHDSIFICGSSVTETNPFYAILDSNFTIKYQTFSSLKGVNPKGISLTNKNTIHIVSNSFSKKIPNHTYIGVFRFHLTGSFPSASDIGVTSISNLNTRLISSYAYMEMDVTVKNFGTDTVKEFYINRYSNHGGINLCYLLLHKKIQTPLAPGATLTVPSGSFLSVVFPEASPFLNGYKLNVCIFTSVPNAKNDANTDNDATCDTLVLTTTGMYERSLSEQNIQIFPNPFSSGIMIQSDQEIQRYLLYNSLGEMIKEEKIQAREVTILLEELSPGIYFIRIESENGLLVKKLIKND